MGARLTLLVVLGVGLFLPLISAATDPAGVVSNVILGQGVPVDEIDEHVKGGDTWVVKLETKGQSDFFYQDLVVGPGGRTGWHSHPGLLMITIKEGSVDFYDKDCRKSSFSAGQSFTESADPHNAFNTGTANARLLRYYGANAGRFSLKPLLSWRH